ncbi:MAG: S8 family serine peptidase [Deltaproteobacteria bacterium]|nr:S8 family serine peptidase [Deltaproteobacteria bacterium]
MKWFSKKPRTFLHFAMLVAGTGLFAVTGSMRAASEASPKDLSTEPSTLPSEASSLRPCPTHATSWEIVNNNKEMVDGLSLNLQGLHAISEVYLGERNPFGQPTLQSLGPDDVYRLRFSGSEVGQGSKVQIALCGDSPAINAVPLGGSPAVSWLNAGESLSQLPAPSIVGHRLQAESSGNGSFRLSVEITQAEARDLRLENVEFALGDSRSLADLSYATSSDLPWSTGEPAAAVLPAKPSLGEPSRVLWDTHQSVRWDDSRALFARFAVQESSGLGNATESVIQFDLDSLLRPLFLKERALAIASAEAGRGDLEVAHSSRLFLPLTKQEAYAFKLHGSDGKLYQAFLQEDGREVSGAELLEAEEKLAREIYGKLEPSLFEVLANADPEEPLNVSFWLTLSQPEPPEAAIRPHSSNPLTEEEIDSIQTAMDSYQAERVTAATDSFLERLTAFARSVEPATTDLAPLVHVALTPGEIEEVATWEEVDRVYGQVILEQHLSTVRSSVQSFIPNTQGVDGTGEILGVLEVGGAISASNPFLPLVVQNPTFACLHEHGTAVAGVIASNDAIDRGMAPGAALRVAGSCGGLDAELEAGAAWQVTQGARAINLSLGSPFGEMPGSFDRFFDSLSINSARTIVASAGNNAGGYGDGSGKVGSPARGFNVISVGNYNDRNIGSNHKMSDSSSFVDPVSNLNDREKPEVAAPGNDLRSTTNSSPWIADGFSGTSFSAPVVTGGVGLLFDANPALQLWPEAVKAILMATATENIEGLTRLSDKDGAGGVRLDQAVAAAGSGANTQWIASSADCSLGSNYEFHSINLLAGQRARVALVWGQPTNQSGYASEPSTDIDLQVVAPDGTQAAYSFSFDNTYEIVDFVPDDDGLYLLNLFQGRCDQSPMTMAAAWWQDPVIRIGGLGHEGEGAGLDLGDINADGESDLLLMAYDAPSGANSFKYMIGFNLDSNGRAASWSPAHSAEGVGHSGEGAGAKLVNINGNSRPDLIVMAYDAPSGSNEFRYRIGWDLDTQGEAASWSNAHTVGGVGNDGDGASIEVVDFDRNGRMDLVVMAYDDPANQNSFRYKVGFDLNSNGVPASWGPMVQIAGVGHSGHGAGMAIGYLDNDERPEMILMAYDSPPGINGFRYRIGWNVGNDGTTTNWSSIRFLTGVGWDADGADIGLFDTDNDGIEELFLMAYDDPPGNNSFRYVVVEP